MLIKLLKYDIKKYYKYLSAFYIALIFFATLTRCISGIEGSYILDFIKGFIMGITIGLMIGILINNLINLGVRFKATLYEDESYLTHTLPIKKSVHYIEKIILSIITVITSILLIFLALFILFYSKENMEALKLSLSSVANMYNSSVWGIISIFLMAFMVEYMNMIQSAYTGIILGHRMNNNKMGFSIVFTFITYMLSQIIALGLAFIIALINKDLLNLFITNEVVDMHMVKLIGIVCIGVYLFIYIVNLFINIKIFNKGVNVD